MNRKTLALILVPVIAVSGGLYYRHASAALPATRYVTAQAAKGTLTSTVSGTGNVVASQSVKVSPSISGTVANLAVKLGDQVKKGQTLFTLTNESLGVSADKSYASYLQSKQALSSAQAQVITAQATATNQAQDSGQAKAQAGLDAANQQVAQVQSQLAQDQQALAAASSTAANYATLQAKVAADQATVTADQSNVSVAQIALDQSKTSGTASAQAAQLQLSAAQQAVTIAQKNVDNALADYSNQKANADQRTVTSPIDGTITTLSIGNGDQLGGGSGSSSSAAPVAIEDLGSLQVTVQINEVDAPSVKVGQKAAMTFDAISGLSLTGKVTKIDAVGAVSSGVVTYGATIEFDSIDAKIRPGMSVSATITTLVKQDVLSVPSSAVKTSAGSSYVQLLQSGAPVQQAVETGATSDTETEITSGLKEGDPVITQTITAAAQASASKAPTAVGIPGLGGGGTFRAAGGGRGGN